MSLFGRDELSALRESHARELRAKDNEIARLWALVGDLNATLHPPRPVVQTWQGKPRDPEEKRPEEPDAYVETGYPAL